MLGLQLRHVGYVKDHGPLSNSVGLQLLCDVTSCGEGASEKPRLRVTVLGSNSFQAFRSY